MRILLVDDDAFTLKILSSELEQLGYAEIMAYSNPYTALSLLDGGPSAVDVIFLDLQMPGMDGVEFIRQLVKIGFDNAVILISGEDDRILQTAAKLALAHKLNVLGSLSKPTYPEKIRALLEQHAYRREWLAGDSLVFSREELERALGDGELVIYYQPQVELASGRPVAVEALVRWSHPQHGLVMPDQFIGDMEGLGLVDELTRYVLRTALEQARAWRQQGLNLKVSVNVSMDNLVALDFPEMVERTVREAGAEMTDLVLEVTESRLMREPLAALDVLARLRLKHVSLSIDDFGTGHSSMAQLRDIPFDELKLDRGFVTGAYHQHALRAFVQAGLRLASELGIRAVAEGVESRGDWDFLREMNCDVVQGYFIAEPMPAEELLTWAGIWGDVVSNSTLMD